MALFGGSRPKVDWSRAGTFLTRGMDGLDRRRDEERALQALQQRTMQEDRLRAALSPADGPMGSGTGAAPSIQQQMAALDEARLLNPEVADKFAPFVQGQQNRQQAEQLFPNDTRAQALWASGNPEFRKAQSEQYSPQVIAADAVQSIAGENRQISNFRPREFGDSIVLATPQGVQTLATRGPTISEGIAQQNANTTRMTAERPQLATVSPGQQVYGVGAQGQVSALAQSTQPRPPSAQSLEIQGQIDTNANEVIPTLNQMKAALQSGDVITGFGAEAKLGAARLAAAAGNQDAQRVVAATEAYRNMSGRLRVGMAKTLGTNPSNADIKLLEQVTGGDIGQNAQSLLSTIDQGLMFANNKGAALNSQLNQAGGVQPQQGAAPSSARPIAVNPQTGERVQWNGSAWVAIR